MRSAPPVQMTCGGDARWRCFEIACPSLAAGVGVGWVARLAGATPPLAWLLAALAAAAVVAAAARVTARSSSSRLTWDGRAWSLDGLPAVPSVRIDLGAWMLLHIVERDRRRGRWWPLDLPRCGAPVHLARAALHAHGGQPAPASGPEQPADHG